MIINFNFDTSKVEFIWQQNNNKYFGWANKGGRNFENCLYGYAVSMFQVSSFKQNRAMARLYFNVPGVPEFDDLIILVAMARLYNSGSEDSIIQ